MAPKYPRSRDACVVAVIRLGRSFPPRLQLRARCKRDPIHEMPSVTTTTAAHDLFSCCRDRCGHVRYFVYRVPLAAPAQRHARPEPSPERDNHDYARYILITTAGTLRRPPRASGRVVGVGVGIGFGFGVEASCCQMRHLVYRVGIPLAAPAELNAARPNLLYSNYAQFWRVADYRPCPRVHLSRVGQHDSPTGYNNRTSKVRVRVCCGGWCRGPRLVYRVLLAAPADLHTARPRPMLR